MISISFVQSLYTVSEDAGFVSVCLELADIVEATQTAFVPVLSTSDGARANGIRSI